VRAVVTCARFLSVVFFYFLIVCSSAFAQNRANFPWWNSPVVTDLGLSQGQTQKIRQIVRSYRSRLLDARNNVQKAEGDLEDLLNDPDSGNEAADSIIKRVADARAVSARVFLEMSFQLRRVLTQDQWRQLIKRWEEVQRRRPVETQVPPE
jgi:Spy/CpxP family protein refolding chaperone